MYSEIDVADEEMHYDDAQPIIFNAI